MFRKAHWSIALSLCISAFVPAIARAQESPDVDKPEEQRRKEAKQEQAETRRSAEQAETDATAAQERERESARLKGIGAEGERLAEEERGFFLRIEAFLAEAKGAQEDVARVGTVQTAATTAEELDTDSDGLPDAFTIADERLLGVTFGSRVTPRVELGWRTGTGAALSLRYWAFSQNGTASASSSLERTSAAGAPPVIVGGIDSPGIENDFGAFDLDPEAFARPLGTPQLVVTNRLHGADSVAARSSLEAHRFDLLYSKAALVRPRFELAYRIGLEAASVERETSAQFVWRSFSQAQVGQQARSDEAILARGETTGWGPLVGIEGRLGFTASRRWLVRFGLDVAGLKTKQKLAFRDAHVFSQELLPPRAETFQDTTADQGDFTTLLDADLGIEGRWGRRFQVGLGYRFQSWRGSLVTERFPDPNNTALLLQASEDLEFTGPYLGVGIFF